VIRITSKKDGFRRAGKAHPDKPTTYPDEAFTPEQLKALKAEPMLIVDVLPGPGPEPEADPEPEPKAEAKAAKRKDK
jgi:hypothetical protein